MLNLNAANGFQADIPSVLIERQLWAESCQGLNVLIGREADFCCTLH